MLVKIYAQPKVAKPLKVRLSLRNCCKESKYRHFRHSQAPVYIGSFSLTINTSPNTPMTPKESHGLHLSCPHVIPSTPNEERAVDEDRAAQTDSEVDGI
ncbi:hypothetical protein FOCG_18513 [Fusarium oxysporum f. sp. radicis-lycopersici 26381]|nr:hypothetical protein FOCG_18513 [Fusarium oxysporum f. sp. radicis-lycopersici 26381]